MNSDAYPCEILLSVVWSGSNCIPSHVSRYLSAPTLQQLPKKKKRNDTQSAAEKRPALPHLHHGPQPKCTCGISDPGEYVFVCVGGFLYKLGGTVIASGRRGNSFKYIRKEEKKQRGG